MDQTKLPIEDQVEVVEKYKNRIDKLIKHLLGGKYRLPDSDQYLPRIVNLLRQNILELPRPESTFLRYYYFGDVTLAAVPSKRSMAVYLYNARKQLSIAMGEKGLEKLTNLCVDISEIKLPGEVDIRTLAQIIWGRPSVSSIYAIIREVKSGKRGLPMPRLKEDGYRRWVWTKKEAKIWRDHIIERFDSARTRD